MFTCSCFFFFGGNKWQVNIKIWQVMAEICHHKDVILLELYAYVCDVYVMCMMCNVYNICISAYVFVCILCIYGLPLFIRHITSYIHMSIVWSYKIYCLLEIKNLNIWQVDIIVRKDDILVIMSTCQIIMSTFQKIMLTCQIMMSTCQIMMSTCQILKWQEDGS